MTLGYSCAMGRRWVLFALVLPVWGCTGPDEQSISQAVTCPTDIEGVDVYTGTGTIDWTKVKADGRDFAFIKATQGNYNMQSTPTASSFATNWAASKAAGVLRSPYHFFDGTIDGVTQANYFLDNVTMAGGLQVGDLPPMLDIECPTSSSQSTSMTQDPNCEYTGNSGWVDSATLAQRIFDWLDTVHTATGTTPILYSYVSWFASVAVTDPRLANYPLYIASYNACPTIPAPWTAATFWQYSASTQVNGIAQPGDVDRFFGSAADLNALTIQPPMADAGVQEAPDAETMNPPPPGSAGCGCRGAGSPAEWSVGAFVLLLVLRRRKVAR